MKKKILFISFVIFVFAILLNVPSFATFYISNFQIDANLDSKGDMQVKEKITYYTDETVNGLTRKIVTENDLNKNNSASGLELTGVFVEGKPCENVAYANIGDDLVYEFRRDGTKEYNIKLYSPFITNTKTIEYDYVLRDVAVRYNDIGELYWNFIGKEWDSNIENLTINIILPEFASRGTSYVYGHGSDNGSFTKSGSKISLYARDLAPHQALDARILFKKEAISDSSKVINKDVLEKYINDEEGFYENQEERKVFGNLSIRKVAEILTIIVFGFGVFAYFSYDKEFHVDGEKYCREIPYDLSPEMAQYIYYGKIKNNSFYITFLNLIKKGVFKLEERTNKVGKNVQTIIYNENEKANLTVAESSAKSTILGFLTTDSETAEKSIDVLTLSQKMKNSTGYGFKKYSDKLETEKESLFGEPTKIPKKFLLIAVILMACIILIISACAGQNNNNSMEFNGEPKIIIGFVLGFITLCYSPIFASLGTELFSWLFLIFHCGCFQGFCIAMLVSTGAGWLYIPYILCFILIQYLVRIKKYSIEERSVLVQIKGLRKYIKDYSLLNGKDDLMQNVSLWEDYFIMAIALGLNTKTINYFYNYGKDQVNTNLGNSMSYTSSYMDFHYPVYNSFYTYQRSYVSHSSSSGGSNFSGSSGGFSGGSSSGGGGGRRWRWRTLLMIKNQLTAIYNVFHIYSSFCLNFEKYSN